MTLTPRTLARVSAKHPKRVIAAWGVALVVALAVIAMLLADVLSPQQSLVGTPESNRAASQIEAITGSPDRVIEQVVLQTSSGSFTDTANRAAADGLAAKLNGLGSSVVTSATSPTADARLISKDGQIAVIPVVMAGSLNDARDNIDQVLDVAKTASSTPGLSAKVTGQASIDHGVNKVAEEDLKTGETFGVLIALVILLIVFGTLVAALLPIILAVAAIIIALALTALIGQFGDLSFFVQNMITMMGLAVGIDYALFIVSRYREERTAGVAKLEAIEAAGDTSSRAVFFSGMTVVVALLGLLIVPMSVFVSLGLGAILVVLSAVAAALTLLPAVLSLLGDRIEAGRLSRLIPNRARREKRGEGMWARIVTWVMRRPWPTLIVAAGLLIVASLPYWGINTGASGVSSLPADLSARQAYETLQRDFTVGEVAPALIPVGGNPSSPDNAAEIGRVRALAAGDPVLGTPILHPAPGGGAVLEVPVNAESTSGQAEHAVRDLRAATSLPVGGATSQNIDYFDIADGYLPIVVAIVLALSFIILLVAFRSIVVPIVAIFLNLLSVGAAFGLVTLVTQDGHGAGLFGFQQVDTVEAWIPIFLFAVLFGLSMDYHVFLLSRIKERYSASHSNVESITHGISSSGRLITGAALIMVAVFGGFASGQLVMFQQMGFGLAVAVLIDATIVRGVLLPATMRLLGDWNWYLPKSLAWLPHISVEGRGRAPVPAQVS